jgi:hypothetical protein
LGLYRMQQPSYAGKTALVSIWFRMVDLNNNSGITRVY